MTTYAYTTWFFPMFLVACISSVLFVSIRSVLKPLSQYESHITSEGHGNSDSKWKLAPRNRGYSNGNNTAMNKIEHHDMHYSHRQNYDSRRFPWLYRNILQQEESAKFGIHSGDGYHHTSQLREHLQRLQVEKLKKKEELQRSDSDENSDLTVLTDVSFAQPQGLHVNLEIKIEISQFRDKDKETSCSCKNEKNGLLGKEGRLLEKEKSSHKENENDGRCLKTRNVAVVFFLPSGCYIDQQEIEARHSFPVDAEKIFLHTYAASSNPELLAEEAEGEVVVVEFFDLLDNQNCPCSQVERKNKNDNKYKVNHDKYKTGNENGQENIESEGSDNHDRNKNKNKRYDNDNNHNNDNDSSSEFKIEHENENENEYENEYKYEMKNDNDSEEEEESVKRKRKSDTDYHPFNATQHTVHGNHHKTVKRKNIRTIITDFNFQLPIHLRYHTPYSDFLPGKNTKTGEYPYHKKVIIPYPTVFIGMENCIQNPREEAKNAKNIPRIKRIYDVSFLGQTGNVQSSMISENFYVKLNGFVDKKNYDNGEERGGEKEGGQDNDEEEELYEHEKQGQEKGDGEQMIRRKQRQRERERDKKNKDGKKISKRKEGAGEEEEEQTIELKVPVGCYSNDFVLVVTIACYFFSSSAIVYSLVF